MMDIVKKNGDKINIEELSRELGCKVVEISALKGTGIKEAADAAVEAAKNGKTVPMHTFSGPVEHTIAHIEEAAVHNMPEEQQRWYAIKLFERDDKVIEKLNLDSAVMAHIDEDIKNVEKELDDDAESIITKAIICSGIILKKDKDVRRRSCTIRYGASCLPYPYSRFCTQKHVGAWLVIHQEGWYDNHTFNNRCMVHNILWIC